MLKIFLIILSVFSVSFALTIDEAVQKALENNWTLKSYIKMTEAERLKIESAKSAKMPTFFLDSSYTLLDDKKEISFSLAPGVNSSMTQVEKKFFESNMGFRYNIFTGGAVSSNIEIKKAEYEAALYDVDEFKNFLIYSTKKRYIEVLKAQSILKIATKHKESLKSHYRDVQKLLENGMVAKIDLLQTNVKLKEAEQEVTNAENILNIAISVLNNLLGNPIEEEMTPFEPDIKLPAVFSLNIMMDDAINSRKNIKAMSAKISALESSKKIITAEYLPKIYFAGGYKYSNQNDMVEPKGGFFAQLGLKMEIEWNKPTKDRQSVNSLIVGLISRKLQMISDVRLSVKNAYESLNSVRNNLDVAKSAIDEAEEYYRIVKLKYANGLGSNSDVLDAEALYTSAIGSERNAYYEVLEKYFMLEYSVGKALR